MRAWTSSLLAVLPWLPPADLPRGPAVPCAVALEVQVQAHLEWGSLEWHLFTGEVERAWAPYGVTFCWAEGPRGCGLEARVRVLIADDLPRRQSVKPRASRSWAASRSTPTPPAATSSCR
jgi:hypothetical protein